MKSELKKKLNEFHVTEEIVTAVLQKTLSRGGDFAELFFEEIDLTRIFYENQRLDRLVCGSDRGVGLRVIVQGRSVYGYTTDLKEKSLLKLAQVLSDAVGEHGKESHQCTRPDAGQEEWQEARQSDRDIDQYCIQKSPQAVSLQDKIELVKRADAAVRRELSDARQVTAVLLETFRKILILNSDHLMAQDTKTYLQMMVQVVGEKNGRVETAYTSEGGYLGMEFFDQVTPEALGEKAAKRVKLLLSAKPAPSGSLPVVISAEAGGTMIHEAVGHGLEADLACNGLSVYQNKLGQQVASSLITVLDDGTMPAKRGSYRFDDEGTPSKKNVLIENGILKSYMVDRLSAFKFDLMATGNGRRESFRHTPMVRMTNTYIAPGKQDPDSILRETERGIFVKAMGGGQVNTVTGDFVFAVTEGFLIEGGRLTDPIRGATLVGNGPKVLSEVDRVGNDLGFSTGTCGKDGQAAPVTDAQPTLRIPELTVGGEVPIETYWKSG
jgi:TldD protein